MLQTRMCAATTAPQELGPSDPALPKHESQEEQQGEQRAHSEGDREGVNRAGRFPHGWLRQRGGFHGFGGQAHPFQQVEKGGRTGVPTRDKWLPKPNLPQPDLAVWNVQPGLGGHVGREIARAVWVQVEVDWDFVSAPQPKLEPQGVPGTEAVGMRGLIRNISKEAHHLSAQGKTDERLSILSPAAVPQAITPPTQHDGFVETWASDRSHSAHEEGLEGGVALARSRCHQAQVHKRQRHEEHRPLHHRRDTHSDHEIPGAAVVSIGFRRGPGGSSAARRLASMTNVVRRETNAP